MSLVCHLYVTRIYWYVIRMYSFVTRMSLLCGFTMNHVWNQCTFFFIFFSRKVSPLGNTNMELRNLKFFPAVITVMKCFLPVKIVTNCFSTAMTVVKCSTTLITVANCFPTVITLGQFDFLRKTIITKTNYFESKASFLLSPLSPATYFCFVFVFCFFFESKPLKYAFCLYL